MVRLLLFTGLCFFLFSQRLAAQATLPDIQPEDPAPFHYIYKNVGQLADDTGQLVPYVRYYTQRSKPQLFFQDNMVSFTFRNSADTASQDSIFRFDWMFLCPNGNCGTIKVEEPGTEQLNYYFPHCAPGITGVTSYARLYYEEAFPKTDIHFYSNGSGMKNYFVVHPGGNPNNMTFYFFGQDSLNVIGNDLRIKIKGREFLLPQPTAYELDGGGNVNALGWAATWQVTGTLVKLNTGPYNTTKSLVLRVAHPFAKVSGNDNLEWSTYYGGEGMEHWSRVCTDDQGELYHGMTEAGGFFPEYFGSGKVNGSNTNIYLSKFDKDGKRIWGTYFGGTGNETISDIEEGLLVNTDMGGFYICGSTTSADLPVTPGNGYTQTQFGGYSGSGNEGDGLLASFNKAAGTLSWSTYFGGDGDEKMSALCIDNTAQKLYAAGNVSNIWGSTNFSFNCAPSSASDHFPLCSGTGSRYFQSTPAGGQDGFVTEFDLATRQLNWSTLFGGPEKDQILDILKINANGFSSLYLCGYTTSNGAGSSFPSPITSPAANSFPLAQPSQAYFRSVKGPSGGDGFISRFDAGGALSWSTFFGGQNDDKLWSLAANSHHEVYAAGYTASTASGAPGVPGNLFPVLQGKSGAYFQPVFGGGTTDAVITQFSKDGELLWSTYYGGSGDENNKEPINTCFAAVDDLDNVYIAGYSNIDYSSSGGNVPVYHADQGYWQPANASTGQAALLKDDSWILMLDAVHEPLWATHFGGTVLPGADPAVNAHEIVTGLAISGHKYLFTTGLSTCPATPMRCPSPDAYCDNSYNGISDAYITRFRMRDIATDVDVITTGNQLFSVYPNPSGSDFTLQLSRPTLLELSLRVYNSTGSIVRQSRFRLAPGQDRFVVRMDGLPAGIYFAELGYGQTKATHKLVKMR